MTKINATIVADSLSPKGDRLTSLLITFPRIILAEVNTHRMLSKNTSSSRAIPFNKMIEAVEENPFIPIAWQKEHKGMQGSEYIIDSEEIERKVDIWLNARDWTIKNSKYLNEKDVTKQLCNRLLEPFMWTTMLITGSKEGWDNFFDLRCSKYSLFSENIPMEFKSKKDLIKYVKQVEAPEFKNSYDNLTDIQWLECNKGQAEIHMMALAECIYDAMNESTPKQLQPGEWHIPFKDKIKYDVPVIGKHIDKILNKWNQIPSYVKVSTAMAARTSYTVVGEEKEIDYSKMIELHDKLINQNPPHSSPLEHCARVMTNEEYSTFIKGEATKFMVNGMPVFNTIKKNQGWCNNLKGFIPYRYIINNNIKI